VGLLEMTEQVKPPNLAKRGGLWLRSGEVEIHLGVEKDFRAARKAHPAIRTHDIDDLVGRMTAAGYDVIWDDEIKDVRRFFTYDPVGNRIEFVEDR
jgi:hypothetical protein